MKSSSISKWLIVPATLLLLIVALAPTGASAQSSGPNPLPLPDVIFYGTVMRDGQPLESGVVKALLPRGVVTAEISPVSGTGYSYVLAVPLSMYDPDNGVYASGSAKLGEMISFQIDDTPAVYLDANDMTTSGFVIPADAVGGTYVVNLFLSGPDAYPLGDVNASGRRDSADALLVLKYDVGLIEAAAGFPPGPRTIYVPLCDIIEDGQCNSSDALRILQCDVGVTGVDCPIHPGVAAVQKQTAVTENAALSLRLEIERDITSGLATVRVLADDHLAELGAASLELRYDDALLAVEACHENPDGLLDAAVCNAEFAPGAVRFNAVSTAGTGDGAVLAEITFRSLDPAAIEAPDTALASALTLVAQAVFDLEGNDLAWHVESRLGGYHFYLPLLVCLEGNGENADVLSPGLDRQLYLPLVGGLEGGNFTQDVESSPNVTSPEFDRQLYLPLVGGE